jgi:putative Mg2+ transporter-C (MgtC) family protein
MQLLYRKRGPLQKALGEAVRREAGKAGSAVQYLPGETSWFFHQIGTRFGMPSPNEVIFYGLDDLDQLGRVAVRLLVAVVLGAILGWQRECERKMAGLRTHMLVALGAALAVLVPVEAGFKANELARVMQGVIMGIGFLGGGTILKLSKQQQIRGLTTAANIWVTAAVGMAVGLGLLWPALIGVVFGLTILAAVGWLEYRLEKPDQNHIIQGK